MEEATSHCCGKKIRLTNRSPESGNGGLGAYLRKLRGKIDQRRGGSVK